MKTAPMSDEEILEAIGPLLFDGVTDFDSAPKVMREYVAHWIKVFTHGVRAAEDRMLANLPSPLNYQEVVDAVVTYANTIPSGHCLTVHEIAEDIIASI